ncbi:glycosyltransferase [Amphibacillus jilinensis]|uniref:glycosyltransferase n=1 Tax=Amphibacillus jilinensis TaxID=1216008 RepID=UPI0002F54CBA|nr:glycosyltransferase [Amphibacillus jilinensis]
MRLLQIIDKYHDGGGKERFLYDLTQKIRANDSETAVICLDYSGTSIWGGEIGCEMMTFDRAWRDNVQAFKPDALLWHVSPNTTDEVKELALKYPLFSIAHNVTCPAGTRLFRDKDEICMCSTGLKCMVNWYVRRCGINKAPKEAFRLFKKSQATHDLFKQSKAIYVATQAMKQSLEWEGIDPNQIKLFDITLGSLTDVGPINNVTREDTILNILYVGRLSYNKGVQYLISAISKLKTRGIDMACYIVGGGWYEDRLINLVEDKELRQFIHFIGKVDSVKIKQYYQNADIVVVPSIWYEAAGLVVPEARQAGKPVVVFDSGGLSEWSNMMNHIYVAKRKDSFDLANTILTANEQRHTEYNDNLFKTMYTDIYQHLLDQGCENYL